MVVSEGMKTKLRRALPRLAPTVMLVLAVTLVPLPLAGCGPSAGQREADRAAIQKLLEGYLPALANAYATGKVDGLTPFAAQKEILSTQKRIDDLAQEGRALRPNFKQLTVEAIDGYQHSNAYVKTVEVWDLKVVAAGSERLISEQLDQHNRVTYQLKRTDAGWTILYRQLVQSQP